MVPTMGLGGTLDHVVSMLIPVGAGVLWMTVGYWSVFALAGLVAMGTLTAVRFMPGKHELSADRVFGEAAPEEEKKRGQEEGSGLKIQDEKKRGQVSRFKIALTCAGGGV